MQAQKLYLYLQKLLENTPTDWIKLTTHRLDIYNESKAKSEFLDAFVQLYADNNSQAEALNTLPTAYDYIRLGHPLSCVLEWSTASLSNCKADNVICFSSEITPILAVLRKNLLDNKNTRIAYSNSLPNVFEAETLKKIYGYHFELCHVDTIDSLPAFDGSTIWVESKTQLEAVEWNSKIEFFIDCFADFGSILYVDNAMEDYIADIQHVRRRETIAMTPINCYNILKSLAHRTKIKIQTEQVKKYKTKVYDSLKAITNTTSKPSIASSGLSMQYAIMMGLVEDAQEKYPDKNIKFVVPPNCYGGTNDQARRVAACLTHVQIVDLPVDAGNDMVHSLDRVLDSIAKEDAIPYIIAEIPTNPRVEVPDLEQLKHVLSKVRKTRDSNIAIEPVFILDQTFCPNVNFLGEGKYLASTKAISYASGSKFPSGGRCTAGYCVANQKAEELMIKIDKHLKLCDNEATILQYQILAEQLPSMLERIAAAYQNTREFVNHIHTILPEAKINFVSDKLAEQGFTPSVFSLDLPSKGSTAAEKEAYKRALNHKLISMMISRIPKESKHCVSYGQLKGCYWTIPATSTQGTTKETDKDYIARVALSGNMDMELHKKVFNAFAESII